MKITDARFIKSISINDDKIFLSNNNDDGGVINIKYILISNFL